VKYSWTLCPTIQDVVKVYWLGELEADNRRKAWIVGRLFLIPRTRIGICTHATKVKIDAEPTLIATKILGFIFTVLAVLLLPNFVNCSR